MTPTLRPVPEPDLPSILPVILAGGSGTRPGRCRASSIRSN